MSTSPLIAIVDDYPRWRSFLDDHLSKQGFTTFCKAANGMELLSHLECAARLPTLCIMDMHMPVMDGFETAKRLKAMYPTIKILAFSTSIGRGIINRMLKSGAHAFLAKGSAPQHITDALVQLLEPQSQTANCSDVATTDASYSFLRRIFCSQFRAWLHCRPRDWSANC